GDLRPPRGFAPKVFGMVLLPFLLALGALPIVQALAFSTAVPLLAGDTTYAASVAMGLLLGLGAVYSARIGKGFRGTSQVRAWGGFIASVLASVGTFLVLFFLFVAALNLFGVPAFGEAQRYGITVVFAFGLFPLALVLATV